MTFFRAQVPDSQANDNVAVERRVGDEHVAALVHVFDDVVHLLPEGVYLTYLKQTGTRFEMRGIAQSSTRVSTFMRNIDASEWLSDPALRIVQTRGPSAPQGGSEFTLFATQRSHATPEDAEEAQVAAK